MSYYRVRYTEPKRAPRFDEFSADDDVDAVRQATRLAGSRPAELWCGERRVMILNAAKG